MLSCGVSQKARRTWGTQNHNSCDMSQWKTLPNGCYRTLVLVKLHFFSNRKMVYFTGRQAKSLVFSSLRGRMGGGNPEKSCSFVLSWACGRFPLPKAVFPPIQRLLHLRGLPENTNLAEQLDSYLHEMTALGLLCRITCLQAVVASLEGDQGLGDHIHFELGCL